MLSLSEIEAFYPKHLKKHRRLLLREYLQHKILGILFESAYGPGLCFMGGTCLRIIHQNQRFSEDLDFDNQNLSQTDFDAIAEILKKELTREGYEVDIRNVYRGTFHCYIKFSDLLFDTGLSGHKEEKMLIQLDAEPQHFDYKAVVKILNKFDVFASVRTTPLDVLLAQKFYAICNRKVAKGRDFYDVTFLLPRTKPNYSYLTQKMGIESPEDLRERVLSVAEKIDFEMISRDVQPFLFSPEDAKRVHLFSEYLREANL